MNECFVYISSIFEFDFNAKFQGANPKGVRPLVKKLVNIFISLGRLHVTATSGVALASGLYNYLKYYCSIHVSWSGHQLALPSKLPSVDVKVKKVFSDR